MARFQRLIALWLLAVCVNAWATFPATRTAPPKPSFSANMAGCLAYTAFGTPSCEITAWNSGKSSLTIEPFDQWVLWVKTGTMAYTSQTYVYTYSCPSGSTLSGSGTSSICTCAAGYVEQGSSCASQAQLTCDSLNSAGAVLTSSGVGASGLNVCYNGFLVRAGGAAFGIKNGVKGPGSFFGPYTCSGQTCTGVDGGSSSSTTTPPNGGIEPGAANCTKGQYWGTVNGVSTCVNATSSVSGGSSQTATAPGGSASAPTSGLGTNAPPTATGSTQQTECSNGTCTTRTDYTNASGSVVGSTSNTQPQTTFCQDNPSSSLCTQSAFGGDCGAAPACTGDAIQCAVAKFTLSTKCALTVAPTNDANINAFNTAAAQQQGDQTAGITSTVNIGANSFDQTDVLGAHGQLQDQTVSIGNHQVVIPWSLANDKLLLVGQIMQAVTFLLCLRIVFRG